MRVQNNSSITPPSRQKVTKRPIVRSLVRSFAIGGLLLGSFANHSQAQSVPRDKRLADNFSALKYDTEPGNFKTSLVNKNKVEDRIMTDKAEEAYKLRREKELELNRKTVLGSICVLLCGAVSRLIYSYLMYPYQIRKKYKD